MVRSLNKSTIIGLALVAIIIASAVLAPILSTQDPNLIRLDQRFQAPSTNHLFGTDQNGADIFSQVLYGAQISLTIAFSVVIISVIIGLLVGTVAGYFGGWRDTLIMRFIDMIFAFPGFLLILAVAAVLQTSSASQVIFVLCLTGWTGYARLVRGEILHLKTKEYVVSARALGTPITRQLYRHIWPNLMGPLLIQATFAMAGTIITESSLSFLGIGVSPSTPTWGSLLSSGRHFLLEAPHLSFFPGVTLFLLVLGLNILGDGLRDHLDPKE